MAMLPRFETLSYLPLNIPVAILRRSLGSQNSLLTAHHSFEIAFLKLKGERDRSYMCI